MRVLVTGGAGFIGSALVRHLVLDRKFEVLNVDNLTYAGNLSSLSSVAAEPTYQFAKVDIVDFDALWSTFEAFCPDRVMHLAAESHVDRSISGPGEFIKTNVLGTFNVLECARRRYSDLSGVERDHFRVLHVSTDEVYGSLGAEGLFTEQTRYDPSSPYSASKAGADHLAKAWARTYDLPVIVSNCSNNYGPFHFPEKLIPLAILNAIEGRSIPVYGNGANVRDWLYVDDHARALDTIVSQGTIGETYNVGGHNERTNLEVVKAICASLDEIRPAHSPHSDLITFVADRPGHDARYAIDPTRIETELAWSARENFQTGIRKTVQWYVDNSWWWQPLRDAYDGRRLGLARQTTGSTPDGSLPSIKSSGVV